MSDPGRLGMLLLSRGVVTRDQLYIGLEAQRKSGKLLGTCLVEAGFIPPATLLVFVAEQAGLPWLPLGSLATASDELAHTIRPDLAALLQVVPYELNGKTLSVALADGRAVEHLDLIAATSRYTLSPKVALETEVEAALRAVFGARLPKLGRAGLREYHEHARAEPIVLTQKKQQTQSNVGPAEVPVLLGEPKRRGTAPPAQTQLPPRAVTQGPPPPAPSTPSSTQLESDGVTEAAPLAPPSDAAREAPPGATGSAKTVTPMMADASEALNAMLDAEDLTSLTYLVASACAPHYDSVLVLKASSERLDVRVAMGAQRDRHAVLAAAVPGVAKQLEQGGVVHGTAADHEAVAEMVEAFGVPARARALLACLQVMGKPSLVIFATRESSELSEEQLEWVELVLRETETALALLTLRSAAPIPLPTG